MPRQKTFLILNRTARSCFTHRAAAHFQSGPIRSGWCSETGLMPGLNCPGIQHDEAIIYRSVISCSRASMANRSDLPGPYDWFIPDARSATGHPTAVLTKG
ncbi:Hypothetical protein GbCGDNIH3_2405 [Granulibacter bethesdensis]|uniref:Uncharacterized protein n=1 Tax=Granulibacter bethesdensis TaxID=364410 RepID=A0AAN0RG42_9PROT|nr:Hypothetical protein GbCGDNIH3_2405 [Granulibacter bethesdensis]